MTKKTWRIITCDCGGSVHLQREDTPENKYVGPSGKCPNCGALWEEEYSLSRGYFVMKDNQVRGDK